MLHFSKANAGSILQFSKTKYPIFLHFPKIFVEELLVWGLHSMIIKCFNRAESIGKSHILHDCEHIIPISRKFYTKCLLLPIKYGLPKASIHELYDTLIWSKIHHFFTNRHIYQFCTQNRFTFVQCIRLIYWVLQVLQLYTFQRGETLGVTFFLFRGVSWNAVIWLMSFNLDIALSIPN